MKRLQAALLTALLSLTLGAGLVRASDTDPVQGRVNAIYDNVQKAAAETTEREALVDKVLAYLDTFIDYDGFSERTLKTTWPTLDTAQKERFKDRFKRLVIRTYAKRFTPGVAFGVEYRGNASFVNEEKTEARVRTTVRGEKVAADVDYLLTLVEGDAWRAIDIVIDDVSMALNWRRQFERIVKKDGFDALIAKIDERIAKE